MVKHLFSIDLEEWYHYEYLQHYGDRKLKLLKPCVNQLLQLLDNHDVRATFFVLGVIAEEQPEVVEMVKERGHEIASHGWDHTQLWNMAQNDFENDLKKAITALKPFKVRPKGYRAPYFSVSQKHSWFFPTLAKMGFSYDSSIFPVKTPLYGFPAAPLGKYKPAPDMIHHDPKGKITEYPASVYQFGKRIPFLGGFYMRTLPYPLIKHMLSSIQSQGRQGVLYFHPWEAYAAMPRFNEMKPAHRFVSYVGNRAFLHKLDRLLHDFQWGSFEEDLKQEP